MPRAKGWQLVGLLSIAPLISVGWLAGIVVSGLQAGFYAGQRSMMRLGEW